MCAPLKKLRQLRQVRFPPEDAELIANLISCGDHLEQFFVLSKAHGRHLPDEVGRDMQRHLEMHLKSAVACGFHPLPKHHMTIHVGERCSLYNENPRHTASFVDESLNSLLGKIASCLHPHTWQRRLIQKYSAWTGEPAGCISALE